MSGRTEARPALLVAVVGVATEVGKTWATAHMVRDLRRRGLRAVARKPAQSFEPADLGSTDAELLAEASGERAEDVCPQHRWYTVPMAPPMAAAALGLDGVRSSELLAELRWPADAAIGFVETVGGVRSPMTDETDSAGFAALLSPERIVLVADAGLGTINAVRLSATALDMSRCRVLLNRYDGSELHQRNRAWLADVDGFETSIDVADVCDWLTG